MAKRWTADDDIFLVAYFDAVGPYIGPHDLGRSEQATINRVRELRASGAWAHYQAANKHLAEAMVLSGHIKVEHAND